MKENEDPEIGDIIIKFNGKTVEDFIKENTKYYPASNNVTMKRNMSYDILRSNENTVELKFIREKTEQTKTVSLHPIDSLKIYQFFKQPEGSAYKIMDGNIGYITLGNITLKELPALKNELVTTKGIIIDIRNYPNAFVPYDLGSFFTSSPKPFTKFTKPIIDNPGTFEVTKNINIPTEKINYPNQLIILINEYTQSQAEFTTMAFQTADNVTVIGSQTAGADGNITMFYLPGGIYTGFSGIGVYYPDGKETQRIGIVPDIEIRPTIEGIKNGKDELLEKAIEVILQD